MTTIEKMLKDDYETVADGLVEALDVLDQVYGLLRIGHAAAALEVVATHRQKVGERRA
jgi:hypothetical protein